MNVSLKTVSATAGNVWAGLLALGCIMRMSSDWA